MRCGVVVVVVTVVVVVVFVVVVVVVVVVIVVIVVVVVVVVVPLLLPGCAVDLSILSELSFLNFLGPSVTDQNDMFPKIWLSQVTIV